MFPRRMDSTNIESTLAVPTRHAAGSCGGIQRLLDPARYNDNLAVRRADKLPRLRRGNAQRRGISGGIRLIYLQLGHHFRLCLQLHNK